MPCWVHRGAGPGVLEVSYWRGMVVILLEQCVISQKAGDGAERRAPLIWGDCGVRLCLHCQAVTSTHAGAWREVASWSGSHPPRPPPLQTLRGGLACG